MAKRRRKRGASCWCAIERDSRGIRNMICSTSKRHTKNLARTAVKAYKKSGRKTRFKIQRTAPSNC